MLIAGTKANRELAGAVNARVSADASMISARALLIRLGAVGLLGLMIGAGIALACLGYARIHDESSVAERLAGVLTQALEKATMHARLDPGASVHLDPDAKVGLDPYAQVHIADRPDIPHPGAAQLRPDSAPASKNAVQTNYTVFKNVKFGLGEVVTGYNFAPDGTLPEREYCYYASGVDDQAYVTTPIAANGRFIAPVHPPAGVEPTKAAAECVWFDGKPTRF
jgi:hypothetical protein